jgi:hypothetical protein
LRVSAGYWLADVPALHNFLASIFTASWCGDMERYAGKHQKEPGHQTRDTPSPVDYVRSPDVAHTAEFADVILARDKSRYYAKASDGAERLFHDVLHCPSLSPAPGTMLRPDPELARSG